MHHMFFNPLLTCNSKIKTVNESTVNYTTLDLTPVNLANSTYPWEGEELHRKVSKSTGHRYCVVHIFNVSLFSLICYFK